MTINPRQTQRVWFRAMVFASIVLPPTTIVHGFGGATYRLTDLAEYAQGCFGECECPTVYSGVSGTFRLTPITITGTYDQYSVSNVDWSIGFNGEPVTGDGTLTNFNEVAALQRLELDLTFALQPPIHLDSHFVTPGAQWPEIDITVSMNDMVCYDTVFWVRAVPIEGDVNGDAIVNAADLLAVINGWGPCPPDSKGCPADLSPIPDGDGVVNAADLLAVIEGWGG